MHNFKRCAEKRGRGKDRTPEEALLDLAVKHEVSIDDIVEDIKAGIFPTKELLDEKFNDAHNYLHLLEGLIQERLDRIAAIRIVAME